MIEKDRKRTQRVKKKKLEKMALMKILLRKTISKTRK